MPGPRGARGMARPRSDAVDLTKKGTIMRRHALIGALLAVAALALGVSSASANRLSVSEAGFGIVFDDLTLSAGGASVACPVVLGTSLHARTLLKSRGGLVGRIDIASLAAESCSGGSATVLTETLPWHIQYESFTGSLPNIASVALTFIGARIRADPEGSPPACEITTTTEEPARFRATIREGQISAVVADEGAAIDLEGGFACELAGDGELSGTGIARLDRIDLNLGDLRDLLTSRADVDASRTASTGVTARLI